MITLALALLTVTAGPTSKAQDTKAQDSWAAREAACKVVWSAVTALARGEAPSEAAFASTATFILSSSEAPNTAEDTLSLSQVAARAAFRAKARGVGLVRLQHFEARVTEPADTATVHASVTVGHDTQPGPTLIHMTLRAELARDPAAWRITHLRLWPTRKTVDGKTTELNRAYWKRLRQTYIAARTREPLSLPHLRGVYEAMKFVEVSSIARIATQRRPEDAATWAVRAMADYALGNTTDALSAVARVRALSAEIKLHWDPLP